MISQSAGVDRATRAATIGSFAIIANQVGGKAVRDALFLTTFGIEHLPKMIFGAALLSVVTVLLTSRILTRYGPGRIVPITYWGSAVVLLVTWLLIQVSAPSAAILLYLHLSIGGSILISWFWSVVNERFDPRTAKRRIGQIATGGTLGGLIGGLIAERFAAYEFLTMASLLPVLAGFHILAGCMVRTTQAGTSLSGSGEQTHAPAGGDWREGLRVVRRNSYLRNLATLVLAGTVAAAFLDFIFKSQAALHFAGGENLLRFFAIFYAATGLLTFLVQSTLTRRFLESLGLARTVAVLPFTVGIGGLLLLVPGLLGVWVATAVRGAEAVLRSSMFRSSYELFYTPVSPHEKRAGKPIVDVGFERLGDALGSGAIQAALLLGATTIALNAGGVSNVSLLLMAGFTVPVAILALIMAVKLHRGYVNALERSLLERAVDLDPEAFEDATTRTTYMQTIGRLGRTNSTLLPNAAGSSQDLDESNANSDIAESVVSDLHDPLLRLIGRLRSGDVRTVRAALVGLERPLDPVIVPSIVRLLGWDEIRDDAIRALRPECARFSGQLIDSLLDPDEEFVIRRRIPRVLSSGATTRVVTALLDGLEDRRFEVRYQCGVALAKIHARDPALPIDREKVSLAVRKETKVDRRVWESYGLLDEVDASEGSPFVGEVLKERSGRGLEHVFTLLCLIYPTEPLRIAYQGLLLDDPNLRGTALEYLESILPPEIRGDLLPLLEGQVRRSGSKKTQEEALGRLLESHESIRLQLDALKRRSDEES